MTGADEREAGGAAALLAAAVCRVDLVTVPREVAQRAKLLILDAVGVQVAACDLSSTRAAAAAMVAMGGPAEASVLGTTNRVAAASAALVNGTMTHALDFDDTHLPSQVHVCGCVLPAALAMAERGGATGRELLDAFVCGAEVAARVGAAAPGRFNDNGFHATGICGPFGAAAAAARVIGLDAPRLAHAFGVAGSQAAGPLAFLDDPASWAKRLHPGWAAHAGCYAAVLAEHGWIGPATIFEAPRGLYASHVGDGYDIDLLTGDFGGRWQTARIGIKPYPTGQFNIPFMDAARRLVDEEDLALDDVAAIECHITPRAVSTVCEPLDAKRRPPTGYAGKFSLPYSVAAMLVRRRATLAEFDDEAVRDPEILAVSERVTYVVDETADFPRYYPGRVVVTLLDGRRFERTEPINLGHPENPLDEQQVVAKFRGCVEDRLSAARAERLAELILDLENVDDVRELTAAAGPETV